MAEKKNKEELPSTLKEYKKWRNIHYSLKVLPYPTIAVPFAVEMGLNWDSWFGESVPWTVPTGFVMALLSTILSILAISKKDSELMKKIGPFASVGLAFLAWGVVCLCLASVLTEFGYLLVYSGLSILGAAVEDAVDNAVVEEKYQYMKKLADTNGLSKKGEWMKSKKEQAQEDYKTKYGSYPVE